LRASRRAVFRELNLRARFAANWHLEVVAAIPKTLRDRGIGFDDGARIFAGPVLIWEDARREYGDNRFRAVGETKGDILHVAFTWRGDVVRIISVRRANRREAELWL
jgi:uncharacterized DUF497 family protein